MLQDRIASGDPTVQGSSIVRRLLEHDHSRITETLSALCDTHPSGGFCLEAAPEAFRALLRSWNAVTEGSDLTRDREIASVVILICARYTRWGVTDLLRGRSTAVLGYCRIQAEGAALVHLFLQDPAKAQEWFDAHGEDKGKRFYRANQSSLIAIM